jgi:hypothetical protein
MDIQAAMEPLAERICRGIADAVTFVLFLACGIAAFTTLAVAIVAVLHIRRHWGLGP